MIEVDEPMRKVEALAKRRVFVDCRPGVGLRMSPHFFNTDEEVDQALERLPEEYRTVVLMALIEEMSYKEIAAALSIPLGTVMSRLHRGRKLLQASLLEYAEKKGILPARSDVPNTSEADS